METELISKRCTILTSLSESSRERLFSAGACRTIKKGAVIFGEREEIDTVDFVLDGFVSLYRNSRYGEIKILFICAAGELLNEVVVDQAKTSVAAKTLSDVTLLRIPRIRFIKMLQEDAGLAEAVFKSLSLKTRRLFHQAGNANGTYPLNQHLAAKIYKLARDYGTDTAHGTKVGFDVTVTFLANMLGAKRETVSRAVSQMKRGGYILHDNGTLIVPSLENIRTLI
ncbi:MAG: Crp/Fnr family transcriptional regulator [bacterium]|nr:Crp/Fnr family transcriptional regulator [bacterium]